MAFNTKGKNLIIMYHSLNSSIIQILPMKNWKNSTDFMKMRLRKGYLVYCHMMI